MIQKLKGSTWLKSKTGLQLWEIWMLIWTSVGFEKALERI